MEKEKILNAWIMTEHLSEGNIDVADKNLLRFDALEECAPDECDYYQFFKERFQDYSKRMHLGEHSGTVIYFDIFSFEEVVDFLRRQFKLEKTDEDMNFGDKFGFALYFDRKLQYDKDKFFYTESEYIRRFKKIPSIDEFKAFETGMRERLEQEFYETSEDAVQFNLSLQSILRENALNLNSCRFRIVQNLENDATNLHSFFIEDLEKAKKVETSNLSDYLMGGRVEDRVNLNSKQDSSDFNGEELMKIMAPERYPLGRFPSNTKYALSFMQQVAVNLTSAETLDISSVNGPPGTGKTTLLKDIFADLIVKQSLAITQLKKRRIKGTSETIYYDKASIGELPADITANSIVVTSSNNGAVQNIVNELPLRKGVDNQFLAKLDELDYFTEIANTQDEAYDGVGKEEQKYWGLFSLEGGRASNMNKIVNQLKRILEYLKQEHIPDETVYQQFSEAYRQLKNERDQIAEVVRKVRTYDDLSKELKIRKSALDALQSLQEQDQQLLDELEQGMDIIKKRHPPKCKLIVFLKKIIGLDNSEKYSPEEKDIQDRYRQMKENVEKRSLQILAGRQDMQKVATDLQKLEDDISAPEIQALIPENVLHFNQSYDALQKSTPWFDDEFRKKQSDLFILALAVRKQFLFENQKNVKAAVNVWTHKATHVGNNRVIAAAWHWINMVIPVISSTFASFGRMMKNIGPEVLGYVFVDEAGQALPQAAIGAIWRSRRFMVVGDPSQIKPVLTLDSSILKLLCRHYQVSEKYLSENASVQTLVDSASRYGFYTEPDKDENSWIGIPLWVHRRCQYPMFTISNEISYHGFMVQGDEKDGKTGWADINGKAVDKYVREQGEFLKRKLEDMIAQDPEIIDKNIKDKVYVISPFRYVAYRLALLLDSINFTRRDDNGKVTNIGTVHTFQGKEAPIVFLVLGADEQSKGAASWAVSEPNIMNVAATRAKAAFYIIGDKKLYEQIGSDVIRKTVRIMDDYRSRHPNLVMDQESTVFTAGEELLSGDSTESAEPISKRT